MSIQKIHPELKNAIASGNFSTFKDLCLKVHPVKISEEISFLEPEEIKLLLGEVDLGKRAEIFVNLDLGRQTEIASLMNRKDLADLLTEMPADDRVDLFKNFPEAKQELILPALAQAEREDIRRLSVYPEGSAGSVMTSEYVSFREDITVRDAINKLRYEALRKETIYYSYIVNAERKLMGIVSISDLILSNPDTLLREVMKREFIFTDAGEDQETAARKIQKYDLFAIPVVNGNNILVGIITHDDAIDVITQEQTEDLEKLMAITGKHEPGIYIQTSAFEHFKNRVTWILILAALGLVSGIIIHKFEHTLMNMMILALYMPMVADTGGNTGSQSATVIVRALALGEVGFKDLFKILRKEFTIALLLSIVLGVLSWAKVIFISHGTEIPAGFNLQWIGFTIAVALGLQVITSTLIGAVLPILAAKFKLDPAVVASPALTTVVDISGLIIYFMTAKLLLGI